LAQPLVAPETTVGELVVVVGAVVVVVVDADVADDLERDVAVDLAVLEVAVDLADVADVEALALTTAAEEVPGISWDITPPKMAALKAAPPVAAPVMRLTFLSAAAFLPPGALADMRSSFGIGVVQEECHRAGLATYGPCAERPL
jgi:hypothetical protein